MVRKTLAAENTPRATPRRPGRWHAAGWRLAFGVALLCLPAMHSSAAEKTVFEFTRPVATNAWTVVNDDVMGGVSSSSFKIMNDTAVFSGLVSLENNGGFASARSLPSRHELAGSDALVIRARGDGQRYKLTVRTSTDSNSPVYQAAFTTVAGEWQVHRLPLKAFVPTFRGRVLVDEPPLDPARISSLGLMISDKQAGPFRLEMAWIKASFPTAN